MKKDVYQLHLFWNSFLETNTLITTGNVGHYSTFYQVPMNHEKVSCTPTDVIYMTPQKAIKWGNLIIQANH